MSTTTVNEPQKPLLSNSVYDALKKVVTLVLPASGALYVTLAQLWSLPNAEAVAGTTSATALFLGVVLGVSSRTYNVPANLQNGSYDGVVNVIDNPETGGKLFDLSLNGDPQKLEHNDVITFRVNGH